MSNIYLKEILILKMICLSFNSYACDCECERDCSFSVISNQNELVALVKVIEYSDFLNYIINGDGEKMPFSMTVEIIKKYKGVELKKRIKIWGDNGTLCRPYISNFEVGKYYLISPSKIKINSDEGNIGDYEFVACWTDYLTVDFENRIAYGEYSKKKSEIMLKDFESKITY